MIWIVSILFIIGYLLIAFENQLKINKALTGAALGAGLWILIALIEGGHGVEKTIEAISSETFGLVVFLLSAMTLVEVLVHYRVFDIIRIKLFQLGLHDTAQLWLIAGIAFFLSAIIDNLTTTLVMVQIARRFFSGKNLLLAAAAIVISANAGGAFSPIGDVTTIMLWLAGKFTASEIMLWGFLPSVTLAIVSTFLMVRQLEGETSDEKPETYETVTLSRSEKIIVTTGFLSFGLPVTAHLMGLPPFVGILFGVGVVGAMVAFFRNARPERESHLTMDIEHLLKKVDVTSLLFFIGILFAVGALEHLGILEGISHLLFGSEPETWRLVAGSTVLGVVSAILDNIPLTAAAIEILNTTQPALWALLAIAVGTGGSLLVIGSAAGVVAMNMVKGLTFKDYIKIATLPAGVGYVSAIAVWCVQYYFFG